VLPVESRLTVLRHRPRGAGWQTDRILDGLAGARRSSTRHVPVLDHHPLLQG